MKFSDEMKVRIWLESMDMLPGGKSDNEMKEEY